MTQFQPFSPVDIRFCTLDDFEDILSSLSGKRVIVLADGGTFGRIKEACEVFNRFINEDNNLLITDIRSNPSVEDVLGQLNMLRTKGVFDSIVAIGGGSCIDLAKAISAMQGLAGSRDLVYEDVVDAIMQKSFFMGVGPADIIAVPTTAGTGAEVTRWATIWDFKNAKKLSVEHKDCFPKAALIIPELTKSMPPRLTLSTGLDALSHAMEAFWARARSPLSQALALASISRIKSALPAVLKNQDDLGLRREMCVGSVLAGLAFSLTKTTACHSISYPLTMSRGIEHGFAAALTLSPLMAINAGAVPEISEIKKLFGGAEGFDTWISGVTQGIQELKLSAFGVKEHMIDEIVQGAYTLGRMDNNPYPIERESVRQILMNIL